MVIVSVCAQAKAASVAKPRRAYGAAVHEGQTPALEPDIQEGRSKRAHANASLMDLYRDEGRHPAFCCCRRRCPAAFGGRLVGSPVIAPPDRHPRDPSAAAS
eukprot:262100-Lingulodinium_polyedra.AAC.1